MVQDGNTIILVKGISGSGKSTRVYLFLEFLEHIGCTFEPYMFQALDGKERQVGVYSPDFNMVFVGKLYENNGVRRWQGYDSMTTRLCKAEGLSFFLKETSKLGHGVLIDGAGTTASWRLRPLDLCGESEFTNILHVRYDYRDDQWDEYCARIAYRSGEPPKGDCMWRKHRTFMHDFEKAQREGKEVNEAGGCVVLHDQSYDAPVWDLGVHILEFLGLSEMIAYFKEYCENSDYIQKNSFETFENGKK